MNWNKFYSEYYDCTLDEQIQYSNELTSYGNADEVLDVFMGFALNDQEHARIFLSRVIEANVIFTFKHLLECKDFINKEIFSELVLNVDITYTKDELLSIISNINSNALSYVLSKMDLEYLKDNIFVEKLFNVAYKIDTKLADKIMNQSLKLKTCFTCNQVINFIDKIHIKALSYMAVNSTKPFNREQLEILHTKISDKAFENISKRANIDIIKEKQDEKELDEYVKQQVNDILKQVENESTSIFTKIINKLFNK